MEVPQEVLSPGCPLTDWPPSSPDMNIIKHVWDQLDALIHTRNPLPRNKEEMWAALQEE